MEIVVCVKPLPEAETRLRVGPDKKSLDPEGVKYILTGYDESAVEQALLFKDSIPGTKVRAIVFGPSPQSVEVLRYSLALGCDAATWVDSGPDPSLDPIDAARAVARVVHGIPHDLVLCGKQAQDDEAGLFAPALGELLGLPDVGCVVDLMWDAARSLFTFHRITEDGQESWEAPLPFVVGLQQAWNDPRVPKLPAVLKSRRAPVDKVEFVAPAGEIARSRPVTFELPPARAGARLVEYKTPEEAAEKLVKLHREEAKVLP